MTAATGTRARGVARRAGGVPGGARRVWAVKAGFVALLAAVWEAAVRFGDLGTFPAPTELCRALTDLVGDGEIGGPVLDTLTSWALGLLVSAAIGVPVGLVLGVSASAYRLCRFLLDFLRTIPSLALVPLAVLLYGSGLGSKMLLIVFTCVWPILLQTVYGVRDIDPVAAETCRSYRIRPSHRALFLILPSAAGYLATGVRIAAGVSLLISLSAEIIIPSPGIGQAITSAQLGGAIPAMYAWIAVAGVLGVLINLLFTRVERRALRWHPSQRQGGGR
ncbi:ABC transporter permease [Actinomadura fibrosa]|uniref:ABC transporter permease n=1 Tax=Actinomadura fibrosa TaxID=111802 RepID=A0ABW2Y2Q1_9ACTN|nr:ABC transporter permease subunit [Actinomadura fibrosa]